MKNSSSEQEGRARVAAKRGNTWRTFGGCVLRKMCLLTVTAIRQDPTYTLHSTSFSLCLSLSLSLKCQPKSIGMLERDASPEESLTKLQGLCNFTVLSARRLGQGMKSYVATWWLRMATRGRCGHINQHLDAKYAKASLFGAAMTLHVALLASIIFVHIAANDSIMTPTFAVCCITVFIVVQLVQNNGEYTACTQAIHIDGLVQSTARCKHRTDTEMQP